MIITKAQEKELDRQLNAWVMAYIKEHKQYPTWGEMTKEAERLRTALDN